METIKKIMPIIEAKVREAKSREITSFEDNLFVSFYIVGDGSNKRFGGLFVKHPSIDYFDRIKSELDELFLKLNAE